MTLIDKTEVLALLKERDEARAERDRFEAALARTCLVGGTTYLVERAQKAEAERDEARALVAAAISRAEYHADRNTTAADVFRDISALTKTKGADHE